MATKAKTPSPKVSSKSASSSTSSSSSSSSFGSGKEKTWQEKVERFILLTQGKNMVEELSFVHLFHYQKGNLIVHMIGQPLVLFAAIVSPIAWLMPIQCVFFIALLYTLVYSLWDVKVALFVGSLVFGEGLLALWYFTPLMINWGTVIGVLATILQVLVGHVLLQKRLAAFDIYEFYVIGPFYFFFMILHFLFNYKPELYQQVDRECLRKYGECSVLNNNKKVNNKKENTPTKN